MNIFPHLRESSLFPPPPPQFCNTPKVAPKNTKHFDPQITTTNTRNLHKSLLIFPGCSGEKLNHFLQSSSSEISSLGAICEIQTNACSATFRASKNSLLLLESSLKYNKTSTMPSKDSNLSTTPASSAVAAESQVSKNPGTSKPSFAHSDPSSSDSDRSLQDSGIFTAETLGSSPEPPSGVSEPTTDEVNATLALNKERSKELKKQSLTQVSQSGVMTITITSAPGDYDAKSIILSSSTNGYNNSKPKKDSTSTTTAGNYYSINDLHSNESCNSIHSSDSSLDSTKTVTDSNPFGKVTLKSKEGSNLNQRQEFKVSVDSTPVKFESKSSKKLATKKIPASTTTEVQAKAINVSSSNGISKDTTMSGLSYSGESFTNFATIISNLNGHSKDINISGPFTEAPDLSSASIISNTKNSASTHATLSGRTSMNHDTKSKADSPSSVSPTSSMSLNSSSSSSSSLVSSNSSTTALLPKRLPSSTHDANWSTAMKGRLVKKSKLNHDEWSNKDGTPQRSASVSSELHKRGDAVEENLLTSHGPCSQTDLQPNVEDQALPGIVRTKKLETHSSGAQHNGGTCTSSGDGGPHTKTCHLTSSRTSRPTRTGNSSIAFSLAGAQYSGSSSQDIPTLDLTADIHNDNEQVEFSECVEPSYKDSVAIADGGVALMDPNARPVSHPALDPPSCSTCVRRGDLLFNIQCDGCWSFLKKGQLSAAQVFAVLRQWHPRVQLNIGPLVGLAVKGGSGINDRDAATDMTLLHYAVKAGARGVGDPSVAVQVVEELLRAGADPHQRCKWTHMTALHYAAFFDVPLVIDLLMEDPEGVAADDPSVEYDAGTPLHMAAANLCLGAARSLLLHGADPRKRDARGRTPAGEVTVGSAGEVTVGVSW
ncbi:Ankyrin repeat-containing domain [Trinorchestia longiramus]|nr:Ankyrin repeat-containing domain [Trinorchestia longiramus]